MKPLPTSASMESWGTRARFAPRSAHGECGLPGFVTGDSQTLDAIRHGLLFAMSDLPLLVEGPSGCGKELVARGLHRASGRDGWVPINCGALPEALQEAELFGVKRGAFTGASVDRRGLIEAAAGGTLFMDEVGEMPPAMQAKLLRFLEQGEIRRLGETTMRRVSVRVIAATNRDLLSDVRAGRFRRDLYYRMCGASIRVRGLDERPRDIPLLAKYFLAQLAKQGQIAEVDDTFFDTLQRRAWHGNARELKHFLARAVVVARAAGRALSAGDVDDPPHDREVPESDERTGSRSARVEARTFVERVEEFERRLIVDALRRTGWNKSKAARELGGLKRTTLIGKMHRLGIVENAPVEGYAAGEGSR